MSKGSSKRLQLSRKMEQPAELWWLVLGFMPECDPQVGFFRDGTAASNLFCQTSFTAHIARMGTARTLE
jgi:hypothetical protein